LGGNVSNRQHIHIFSDSVGGRGYASKNMVDLSVDSHFDFKSSPNQSMSDDFKDNQSISLTHYTIRSIMIWSLNNHHPKSWVIEVTNDRRSS
jgi:hypothetical protein